MWRDLFRRGRAPVTLTACLGEGVYALNAFLTSTSMPVAVLEVGGVRFIAWSTTVYLVAAIVAGSATGFLKGRFGARRLLLAAAMLFLVGTLAAGAAQGMGTILVGRAFQGAGEGAIAAACYALVAERLPSALAPKAFGLMALVWAVAAFGGPLLGGLLTETLSWRAAFLVNLPLIAAFVLLVRRAVPPQVVAPDGAAVPFGRITGIAVGIMLIAVAAVAGSLPLSAASAFGGVGVIALMFLLDRRAAVRLFPADAFRPRTTVGAGLWVVLLMPLGQASTSVYLPITLQSLWGWSPTLAGALVGAMALSWSGAALLVAIPAGPGWAVPCIRIGALTLVAGLVAAALAVPTRDGGLMLACQVVIGTGFGVGWAFLNQAVAAAAPRQDRDLAAALVPTAQSAGYAIGAALAGLIANMSGYAAGLAAHTDNGRAGWIFGTGAAVAAIAALFSLGVRRAAPIEAPE